MANNISELYPDLGNILNEAGGTVIERTIQGDVNNSAGNVVLNVGDAMTEATIEADVVHNDGTVILDVGDTNVDATYQGDVIGQGGNATTGFTSRTVIDTHVLINDSNNVAPGGPTYITTYGTPQGNLDITNSSGNIVLDVDTTGGTSVFNGVSSNLFVGHATRDMGNVTGFSNMITNVVTMTQEEYEGLLATPMADLSPANPANANVLYLLTENAIT